MDHAQVLRVDVVAGPWIPGKRHRPEGRAVIGAVPGDDDPSRFAAGLAGELDGVLVGVRAPEAEKDPAALEARFLQ